MDRRGRFLACAISIHKLLTAKHRLVIVELQVVIIYRRCAVSNHRLTHNPEKRIAFLAVLETDSAWSSLIRLANQPPPRSNTQELRE